jgi:hypothetical protein
MSEPGVPRELIERYFAEQEDRQDVSTPLDAFRAAYLDESDYEIERKRKILRNRVLAHFEGGDAKAKLDVLSKIVQDNVRRRAAFELYREIAEWKRSWLAAGSTIVGTLLGVVIGAWIGGG